LACPHLEPRTIRRVEAFGLGGPWGHHRASARDGHEIGVAVPQKPHGHLKMAFTLLQKVFCHLKMAVCHLKIPVFVFDGRPELQRRRRLLLNTPMLRPQTSWLSGATLSRHLGAAVFDAYGWPHDLTDEQILERLVALNAERAEEERRGLIRWLRPEFQNPAGAKSEQQTTMAGIEIEEKEAEAKPKAAIPWPKDLPSQIAAVRDLISSDSTETWTLDRTAKSFKGAKRTQVQSVLDSLAALGLIVTFAEGNARE
jgi:hypothetical protein